MHGLLFSPNTESNINIGPKCHEALLQVDLNEHRFSSSKKKGSTALQTRLELNPILIIPDN